MHVFDMLDVGTGIYLVGMLYYSYNRLKYGESNFGAVKITGPYEVGYTTHKTEKGNFLAIFYPIDKD